MANEMRGAFFKNENRTKDNSPIMYGTITVSGTELRVSIFPAAKSPKGNVYYSAAVEYGREEKRRLVDVMPMVGNGETQSPAPTNVEKPPSSAASDDLPF